MDARWAPGPRGNRRPPRVARMLPDFVNREEDMADSKKKPRRAVVQLAENPAGYDPERIEAAVREFLIGIGEDPDRDGLQESPARIARACAEIFAGLTQDPEEILSTTFDASHDEMVLVRDIEVQSFCEHHLLPFHGLAHVAYIPPESGRVTGLSKIARLVDVYAKRPQVQERLTTQIADALVAHLHVRGALVVVDCEHMCMTMRGVRKPGSRTTTSAVRGQLRDPATRAEAMSLIVQGR